MLIGLGGVPVQASQTACVAAYGPFDGEVDFGGTSGARSSQRSPRVISRIPLDVEDYRGVGKVYLVFQGGVEKRVVQEGTEEAWVFYSGVTQVRVRVVMEVE